MQSSGVAVFVTVAGVGVDAGAGEVVGDVVVTGAGAVATRFGVSIAASNKPLEWPKEALSVHPKQSLFVTPLTPTRSACAGVQASDASNSGSRAGRKRNGKGLIEIGAVLGKSAGAQTAAGLRGRCVNSSFLG
jgi:hypothetical protein